MQQWKRAFLSTAAASLPMVWSFILMRFVAAAVLALGLARFWHLTDHPANLVGAAGLYVLANLALVYLARRAIFRVAYWLGASLDVMSLLVLTSVLVSMEGLPGGEQVRFSVFVGGIVFGSFYLGPALGLVNSFVLVGWHVVLETALGVGFSEAEFVETAALFAGAPLSTMLSTLLSLHRQEASVATKLLEDRAREVESLNAALRSHLNRYYELGEGLEELATTALKVAPGGAVPSESPRADLMRRVQALAQMSRQPL